jgi:hypothetical protein
VCVLVWRLDQIKIVDNANRQVGLSVPHALTTGGFLSFYLFAEDNLPYCVITEWNVNFCCSLIRKRNESIKANEVHDSLVGALFSHLMSRCETMGVLLFTLLWVYILNFWFWSGWSRVASPYLECARLGSRMPGLLSLFSTPSSEIVPFAHQFRLGKHMLKWHDIRKINCCRILRQKSSSFPDQNSRGCQWIGCWSKWCAHKGICSQILLC